MKQKDDFTERLVNSLKMYNTLISSNIDRQIALELVFGKEIAEETLRMIESIDSIENQQKAADDELS